VPFPERIAAAGLPDAFVAHWPLAVDGLALWNAIGAYVLAFLVPFFPDDAAVHADDELRAFWASFEVQFDTPWRLPPLGLSSLVTLVTAEPLEPLMVT